MALPRLIKEPARSGPPRRLRVAGRRARDEWLACTGEERTARSWTVERWLRYWLSTRTHLHPASLPHYTRDVEQVLIPWLGTLTVADLDAPLLRARFAEIAKTTNRRGQPQFPLSDAAPRTTLCAALNLAVREGLIEANPAKHIEIHGYGRPPHRPAGRGGRCPDTAEEGGGWRRPGPAWPGCGRNTRTGR
ncbi:hypothetical protein ABT297_17405 [Dactylosporangium sp. NPDC000555]|uniref:hypothetical protein n=1 Tax=Dactylosporangium sp. NPDC000555 TaxID=3154260 RepID=UPI003333AE27